MPNLMAQGVRETLDWIGLGRIEPGQIERALVVSGLTPDAGRWRRLFDRLLLAMGTIALSFGVIFFVAANWSGLGRLQRLVIVELIFAATLGIHIWLALREGGRSLPSRMALLAACLVLGALLALFGQTYQTGADPWQLFATWGIMILPFALVGRFAPIWILWIALVNLSLVLYYRLFPGLIWLPFGSNAGLLWLTWTWNTVAWVVWEWAAGRHAWLNGGVAGRWWLRLLALASGIAATFLALRAIFDAPQYPLVTALCYLVWLTAVWLFYRRKLLDLFVLAGAALSAIVIVTALLFDWMMPDNGSGFVFLVLAAAIVVQAALAARWLRSVQTGAGR
jgi:uncharacterized membrane protein